MPRYTVFLAWLLAGVHLLPAAAQQLLDTPPNPHWQPDLQHQAEALRSQRMVEAGRKSELGCRAYCALLDSSFARVRQAAGMQQDEGARRAQQWHLVVIRSPGEDAFALPDGSIFISEAFVQREDLSEDEIGFVLAHEAAHVILTHEAHTLDAARAVVPYGVSPTVQGLYATLDFDLGVLLRLSPLLVEMEEEADRVGLMLAALAGFVPERAIGYIERQAQLTTGRPLAATHPDATRRLRLLRETLPFARQVYERSAVLRAADATLP